MRAQNLSIPRQLFCPFTPKRVADWLQIRSNGKCFSIQPGLFSPQIALFPTSLWFSVNPKETAISVHLMSLFIDSAGFWI
jgi:hypothetical protein